MKVKFSSSFIIASKKLSGKMLESLKRTIKEVKQANDLNAILPIPHIPWRSLRQESKDRTETY